MKQPIMACTWIAFVTAALAGNASAAVWRFGCMGPLSENEIVSNRYQLLVIPGKTEHRKLYDLIFPDDLTKEENIASDDSDVENSNADDGNSGLADQRVTESPCAL